MKHLLMVILLILPLSAGAATYSWTDASGTMNFTDDLGVVPKQFRKKVKILDNDISEPQTAAPPHPVKREEKPTPADTNASDKPPVPTSPAAGGTKRYGDRTADEWQTEFRRLRAQLEALDKQLEELKTETGNGQKLLTRGQITDINARNKQLYQERESARVRFNQLVEQANKAGLPSEFSQ